MVDLLLDTNTNNIKSMMVTPKTHMTGAQVSMTLYLGERGRRRGRGRGMSMHQKFRTIICIKGQMSCTVSSINATFKVSARMDVETLHTLNIKMKLNTFFQMNNNIDVSSPCSILSFWYFQPCF